MVRRAVGLMLAGLSLAAQTWAGEPGRSRHLSPPETLCCPMAPGCAMPMQPARRLSMVRPLRDGGYDSPALVREAMGRSPTVETLVLALEQLHLPVYVKGGSLDPCPTSRTTFARLDDGTRYVVVMVCAAIPRRIQVVLLGHEFQHALEIAQAVEAQDAAQVAQLFHRIGRPSRSLPGGFETEAAIEVGRQVRRELWDRALQRQLAERGVWLAPELQLACQTAVALTPDLQPHEEQR